MAARLLALALIALSGLAAGQSSDCQWTGVLRDGHGAPIADAIVRVQSGDIRASAQTAQDGHFTFAALVPGPYSVTADHNGSSVSARIISGSAPRTHRTSSFR